MELNQTTLRGILAQILSVDEKYIVPKQGNWWNQQEANANIATWCAYMIRRNEPRTVAFYDEGTDKGTPVNGAATEKIATIDLQFVGEKAEELANSVALWTLRGDVEEELKERLTKLGYTVYTKLGTEKNRIIKYIKLPHLKRRSVFL